MNDKRDLLTFPNDRQNIEDNIIFVSSLKGGFLTYSQNCVKRSYTTIHTCIRICLAFQTGGCLWVHDSSAESCTTFMLHYFHSAISNRLSVVISMLPEWIVD